MPQKFTVNTTVILQRQQADFTALFNDNLVSLQMNKG